MLRLNKLEVRNVRGIAGTGPDLLLNGKSLILLGDNATGKSSYIDALEYLLTRQCTSLDFNREGVNWAEGGLHIRADAKDLLIKAEIGHGDSAGTVSSLGHSTDLSALSSPLKEWIVAAQQRCFLLRRRTLLRLIEAKPKERYDALSPFFALDRFVAFEFDLKTIADEVDARLNIASRNVTIQEDLLRRAFNIALGISLEEPIILGVVNQRLTASAKGSVDSVDGARRLQVEVASQMKGFSGVEQAAKLETVIHSVGSIPTLRASIEALETLIGIKTSLEDLERQLTRGFAIEVLERGKTWIVDDDLGNCPLCEQVLPDKEAILDRITARIKECSAIIEARRSLGNQWRLYSDSIVDVGKACASAQKAWVEKLGQDSASLTSAFNALENVFSDLNKDIPTAVQLQDQLKALREIGLDALATSLTEELKQLLKTIGGIEEYKNLSAANQALSNFLVSWPLLTEARAALLREQGLKISIDKIIAYAMQARKDTVQAILVGIAAEANRIYLILHPEEKIGSITLKVPARGQGSIDMESEFFGKRSDARLYFSESHLDTLGVALFLALRKKQATTDPQFKMLVLDDIFHSVDSRHRHRAARLIIDEFRDHQFIITTHDPIWFALLQEAVNDFRLRDAVLFRRISGWTLENGPIWGDHEAEYEFLNSDKINTAQPADIASKAGRLLEEILKPLCDQLGISVPFRQYRRYDLGVLWPAFKSTATKHIGFAEKHRTLLEEIDLTDWIRNEIGAHSNQSPAPATMDEAKNFALLVVKLYQVSRDTNCGHFIEEVDAPKGDWVCRCGNLRYQKQQLTNSVPRSANSSS